MATTKQLNAAIVARRASKGPRGKRTRPEPRQYTVADLERAQDWGKGSEAPNCQRPHAQSQQSTPGLERAQLELHVIETQLRLRGLLE
jgi:hypothetical protein